MTGYAASDQEMPRLLETNVLVSHMPLIVYRLRKGSMVYPAPPSASPTSPISRIFDTADDLTIIIVN